jgi:flagellin
MVALQTLKTINKGLAQTQSEISTGKRVDTAKDNAAMWAISSVMNSDVKGFSAISDSLALGDATVAVARDGAETVVDLLNEMKGRIVAAQEKNVDRDKIQADVNNLVDQIQATVDASQFNGLNLLQADTANPSVSMLASLNRSSTGVETSSITTQRIALGSEANVGGTAAREVVAVLADTESASYTINANELAVGTVIGNATQFYTVTKDDLADMSTAAETVARKVAAVTYTNAGATADGATVTWLATGATAAVSITQASGFTKEFTAGGGATAFTSVDDTNLKADQVVSMSVGGVTASYTITAEDVASATTDNVVAAGITAAMNAALKTAGKDADFVISAASEAISVNNASSADAFATITYGESKLSIASSFNVTTDDGAKAALGAIDSLIQTAVDAAASFGSTQKRIEVQSEFISKVQDSLTTGVGAIVDADMEAASARLQALQVQQQLGIQALSIANQQPQSILALFR